MGTQERRARERQRRQEEILAAAEAVFFQKGYEATTVDEVAARVELSKGTVYLYYRHKEDLYLGICAKALGLLNQMLVDASQSEKVGRERVLALCYAHLRFAQQHPQYFRTLPFLYRPEGIDLSEGGNGLRCKELLQANQSLLLTALEAGIADESVAPGLHPLKAALVLDAQLYGVTQVLGQNLDTPEDGHELAAKALFSTFIEMITQYLKPTAAKAAPAPKAAPAKPAPPEPVREAAQPSLFG